jgi:predicted metalloendopeptidase
VNVRSSEAFEAARWRVMGPLSNLPEFAAAFHCNAGDVMVRADNLRAEIW